MEESVNQNSSNASDNMSDNKSWYKEQATKYTNVPAKVGMQVKGFGAVWKIIEIDGDFVRLENESKTIDWMNYTLVKFERVKKWWEFWK